MNPNYLKSNPAARHIILYSKGWYQQENTIQDLFKILKKSEGYGENVSLQYLWVRLMEITFAVLDEREILDFVNYRIFLDGGPLRYFSVDANIERVIDELMGIFSVIAVKDNPVMQDLGEPDYSVLPKAREGNDE